MSGFPEAAKVLAVIAAVYPLIQGLKRVPKFTAFITGWKAIALNVVLTACGLLVAVPADHLYTANTAILLLTTILGSAGIHGTVSAMSAPQVLAITPPGTQVHEVAATLEPVNPKDVSTAPATQKEPT
jgi:hypothetical protein